MNDLPRESAPLQRDAGIREREKNAYRQKWRPLGRMCGLGLRSLLCWRQRDQLRCSDEQRGPSVAAINVASFDLLPGSSLDQNIILPNGNLTTSSATVLFQARLGSFFGFQRSRHPTCRASTTPKLAQPFPDNSQAAQFNVTATASGSATVLSFTPSTTNFVRYYYNNALTANDLTGTGFTDGTTIATGAATIVNGVFLTASSPNQLFDQFGADNYAGLTTITGIGGTAFSAAVSNVNSSFFLTLGVSTIMGNTSDQLAYDQANPSQKFFGTITPNLGVANGVGPDIELQTDGVTSFVIVPEPASLLLLATGAVGLLARRRR